MCHTVDSTSRLLLRYGFGQGAIQALLDHQAEAMRAAGFRFPWVDLEDFVRADHKKALYLVGYGSLLNPSSAARTIADTPAEGHPPVVAVGARRIFNYVMPEAVFRRYGVTPGPRDRAALNAEALEYCPLNGRVLKMELRDLEGLREREKGYDLHPVSCAFWEGRKAPFTAFVLSCRDQLFEGARPVSDDLLPYVPYLKLCRAGAALVSQAFCDFFDETTYLADRVTSMVGTE